MNLGLEGKVAIVSGGTKGVGRAISEELAREGVRVAVAARGQAGLDETVAAIRQAGGQAISVAADMTDPAQVERAVAEAARAFGDPDIAISNVDAPDAPRKVGFEDADDAAFQRGFDVLLMSVVHLTRAVLPAMKAKRWGRLINIGSRRGKQPHEPPTQMVLSNFGRPAVMGLMKTLSYEYGIYNITANVVATGPFATARAVEYFAAQGLTLEQAEAKMRATGFGAGRLGRPEELAALAVFLCSERASFISGETITVTGGMHTGLW